jgi:RNA polymerase primary sigma factor
MRQLKISHSITNRDAQSIDKYFREINKLDLLSAEEEFQLCVSIMHGDKPALDRLVKANLRFVVSVAKQFQHKGLSLADLINEGNIGLIKAARSYDPSRGFKFISYAIWWIRQSIMCALAEQARMIRLPFNKVSLQARIKRTSDRLEQKLERPATAAELAEELNMNPEEISFSLCNNQELLSLDSATDEEGETSMLDIIKNPDAIPADEKLTFNESLKTEIRQCFQALDKRQKKVLCWFFGIDVDHPLSLEDIASRLYVTTERARQIKEKALDILRRSGSIHSLRTYLAA